MVGLVNRKKLGSSRPPVQGEPACSSQYPLSPRKVTKIEKLGPKKSAGQDFNPSTLLNCQF